ncbi:MAG: hypothetical protein K9I94_14515 [Bacteroidales bacterium]|nr:hypothetical protein [Bacteroidales bacterium]
MSTLIDIIRSEFEASHYLEKIIFNFRSSKRVNYTVLHRTLKLGINCKLTTGFNLKNEGVIAWEVYLYKVCMKHFPKILNNYFLFITTPEIE